MTPIIIYAATRPNQCIVVNSERQARQLAAENSKIDSSPWRAKVGSISWADLDDAPQDTAPMEAIAANVVQGDFAQ